MKPYTPNFPGYDFHYMSDKAELGVNVGGAKLSFSNGADGDHVAHLVFGCEYSDIFDSADYYSAESVQILAGENSYLWFKSYDCGPELNPSYALNDDHNNRNGLFVNLKAGLNYLRDELGDTHADLCVTPFRAGGTYLFLFEPWAELVLTSDQKMELGSCLLGGREYWRTEKEMGYCHS